MFYRVPPRLSLRPKASVIGVPFFQTSKADKINFWLLICFKMQYTYDQSSSPQPKYNISMQMSKSQMEKNVSAKGTSIGQELSFNTRKIQLSQMRSKISDVEKMLKTRDRQFLSPSILRGSVGTNNPEPKYTKQNFLVIPTEKGNSKKILNREELRASWNDHLLNMFQQNQEFKAENIAVRTTKKLAAKMNQVDHRPTRNDKKIKINEENSPRNIYSENAIGVPMIQGFRQNDEATNHSLRILKRANSPGINELEKKLKRSINVDNKTQYPGDNYKEDKIKMHINRSQQILQSCLKVKQQKKSGFMESQAKVLYGFEFGKVLGKGKFGLVYLARHIETGFIAAIKKIEKSKIKEFNMINQFTKEIKLHNSLDHPKIIKFYGFFEEKVDMYLVLEYMNGGTLFDHLNKVGFMNIKEAVDVLRDVILAITYLHERSIAHRDIKPENIVISTEGVAKLCDFGWSSVIDSTRHTYCGTLDYACPEILARKDYDISVDIWSIGILTYEVLMGKAPFEDKDRTLVRQRILNVDSVDFSYTQSIPQEAKQFIEALVQKDPSKRPKIGDLLNYKLFLNYGSRAIKKGN